MISEQKAEQRQNAAEAARARRAAEARFQAVHSQWPVVNEVSQRVRLIREHNHFRERIERAFKL